MSVNPIFLRRKINAATTIYFPLTLPTVTGAPASTFISRGVAAGTLAAGDFKVSIDGGAIANTTNLPAATTGAAGWYSLALTAAEMNGAVIMLTFKDQTATFEWQDMFIIIETGLALGKVDINNPAGDAISAVSSGSNGNGITATANGTGSGLTCLGGATNGHGQKSTGQGTGAGFQGVAAGTGVVNNCWDDLEGTEPTVAPVANATFRVIMQHVKRRFFNLVTQTSTQQIVYRDDSATAVSTMAVSDNGTQQSKAKAV